RFAVVKRPVEKTHDGARAGTVLRRRRDQNKAGARDGPAFAARLIGRHLLMARGEIPAAGRGTECFPPGLYELSIAVAQGHVTQVMLLAINILDIAQCEARALHISRDAFIAYAARPNRPLRRNGSSYGGV